MRSHDLTLCGCLLLLPSNYFHTLPRPQTLGYSRTINHLNELECRCPSHQFIVVRLMPSLPLPLPFPFPSLTDLKLGCTRTPFELPVHSNNQATPEQQHQFAVVGLIPSPLSLASTDRFGRLEHSTFPFSSLLFLLATSFCRQLRSAHSLPARSRCLSFLLDTVSFYSDIGLPPIHLVTPLPLGHLASTRLT